MKRFFTRQIRLIGRVVSEFAAFVRFVVGFAYLLVARSFFYVMALYLVVYFTVSTSHFTRFLNNLVSDTMPGRLYFGQVIWGPMPWRVQVFFFSATPPDDEPAIRARYVDTSMNLRRLIVSLLSNALWNDNLLDLYFEETTVHDSETRLVFDDQMNFIFLNTWNDRSPGVGDGTFVRVTMPDIKLVRGSVHLRFPFATIDVDLDDLTSKLYVDGDRVKVYGPTINIRRGSMQFFPGTAEARKKPLRFDWRQMRISSFFTDGRMIRIDKGHGFFPRSGINFSGFINVDDPLSFDLQTELDLRSDDVLVRQFIGDQLKGPLRAKFRLHGTLDDVAAVLDLKSPTLSVTGLSVAALALKGRFQKDYWVNPLGEYAYHIDSLSGKMLGGTLKVEKAVYKPSWTVTKSAKPKRRGKKPGRPVPIGTIVDGFQIKGRLTNVRLDALARYLASRARLGAERKLVERFPFLSGTLNGTIDLTRNRLSHTMTAGLNLKVQQERARAFLARTYSVIGDVGLLFRDPGTSGLDLDPTHWRVTANRLRLISGRDRLQLSGWFDWVDETADLRFSGEIARLRDLLAHFGRRDVSGRLLIQDGRLLGRWENPSVSLRAQIDDAEYGETKLGQVKGRVRIRNGLLAADNVVLLPKWAKRLGGNLTIKLYDASIFKISESFPVTLHRFEAQRLDLRLFDRRIPLEGPIDISNVTLSTTLSRFWPNLRLSGRFDGRTLTAMGERIRLVRGEFRITRDALDLDQFELFVGIAGQRLAGRAHYDRRKHDVDVTFNVRKFNLRTLRTVRHQRVPLFGVVSFNLRATGNVDQIRLSGSAEFDKLRYDSFNLGSARIRLVDRGPLKTAIVADRFFHDLRLLPGAMLRFSGRYPVGLKATVATQEKKPLDLRELLPNLKKRFTQAKLS
ncbi:MAG: hypothetical protein KC609_20570, partial [Myxococcales bacterium]|nr:hypothetical protein [Myxococcales bacterium]